jgi:hypothetical protein
VGSIGGWSRLGVSGARGSIGLIAAAGYGSGGYGSGQVIASDPGRPGIIELEF